MLASIVVRTLDEARYLGDLLAMVGRQKTKGLAHEVVVIDSGSTDGTVDIARSYGARIIKINRSEFSFGRSLNRGSNFARGDILVYISGHCIPVDDYWLQNLCQPLLDGHVSYSYGRQVGNETSRFSERRIFAKYFPSESRIPQEGFFCNNANSALLRNVWKAARFDEELTGLEDMEIGKRLVANGHRIGYVAEALVYHLHSETWAQVRRRFEREALALQKIMPEIQIGRTDILRYIVLSIVMDLKSAARQGKLWSSGLSILRYRLAQYGGTYAGNHHHRVLSAKQKELFFYPVVSESNAENDIRRIQISHCPSPHEGK